MDSPIAASTLEGAAAAPAEQAALNVMRELWYADERSCVAALADLAALSAPQRAHDERRIRRAFANGLAVVAARGNRTCAAAAAFLRRSLLLRASQLHEQPAQLGPLFQFHIHNLKRARLCVRVADDGLGFYRFAPCIQPDVYHAAGVQALLAKRDAASQRHFGYFQAAIFAQVGCGGGHRMFQPEPRISPLTDGR